VHSAAIEQLMRMTDDESLIIRLAHQDPSASLGRLSSVIFDNLVTGCPVLALLDPSQTLAPSWRQCYPPLPHSLYATLELLRSLDPCLPTENLHAYQELHARRRLYDDGPAGPMLHTDKGVTNGQHSSISRPLTS
jgi:hypothetical protein